MTLSDILATMTPLSDEAWRAKFGEALLPKLDLPLHFLEKPFRCDLILSDGSRYEAVCQFVDEDAWEGEKVTMLVPLFVRQQPGEEATSDV